MSILLSGYLQVCVEALKHQSYYNDFWCCGSFRWFPPDAPPQLSIIYSSCWVVCSRSFLLQSYYKSNHLSSFSSSPQIVLHRWKCSCFTSSSTFVLYLLWLKCNYKRRIWGTPPQQGDRRCDAFSFLRFRLWKLPCLAALVCLSVPQMAPSCRPSVSTTSPPDTDLMPNSAVT